MRPNLFEHAERAMEMLNATLEQVPEDERLAQLQTIAIVALGWMYEISPKAYELTVKTHPNHPVIH